MQLSFKNATDLVHAVCPKSFFRPFFAHLCKAYSSMGANYTLYFPQNRAEKLNLAKVKF